MLLLGTDKKKLKLNLKKLRNVESGSELVWLWPNDRESPSMSTSKSLSAVTSTTESKH